MSNDPNCPFGSKPLSRELQAVQDAENLAIYRTLCRKWHDRCVAMGLDGIEDAISSLEWERDNRMPNVTYQPMRDR